MARPHRENINDGIYHVFARGNSDSVIYRDDTDRQTYLRLLGRGVSSTGVRCLAYCLMTTHVHLLVETPEGNLSELMQRVHSFYAQTFNARHNRFGHVFQGRYGAVRIETDSQMLSVVRYIARNPLEAGICGDPGDWPWSSYAFSNGRRKPDWLDLDRMLEFFGGGNAARSLHQAFVTAG